MTLAFLNLGTPEIVMIVVLLFLVIVVANYGKDTALGYWGTLALSLLVSPIVGFVIAFILKRPKPKTPKA